MPSITSLNATLTLSVANLFASPQQLQNFSVDNVYDIDTLEVAETMMSVDGFLSAGLVKLAVTQNITLMASSPSNQVFDDIVQGQLKINDVYQIQGTLTLPSLRLKYQQANGYLRSFTPVAPGHRVLQPRRYTIVWESVTPSAVTTLGG